MHEIAIPKFPHPLLIAPNAILGNKNTTIQLPSLVLAKLPTPSINFVKLPSSLSTNPWSLFLPTTPLPIIAISSKWIKYDQRKEFLAS